MIGLDEAHRHLLSGVRPLASEVVAIADAAGRVLAEDIVARRDQPPAAVSAMDGYAVRDPDAAVGSVLHLIGDAPAGKPFDGAVGAGEAVRIATGGVVPAGADRIVMQEHVRRDGDRVTVLQSSDARFVRPAAGDFAAGAIVASRGEPLTAARLALIAATGRGTVTVFRRPCVAIFASGDELLAPGDADQIGAIFDSASYAIAALIGRWGGEPVRHEIMPDDRAALDARLAASVLDLDLIVPLGGASVGERDQLRPAFEALGAKIVFDRIAVIPGKPTWHARFDDGRLVLGLPGNPASAFVCAHLFVAPLLRALTGQDPALPLTTGRLAGDLTANGPREAWLRGTVAADGDGLLRVTVDPRQDSSLVTPLAKANAFVRRAIDAPPAKAGDRIEYLAID